MLLSRRTYVRKTLDTGGRLFRTVICRTSDADSINVATIRASLERTCKDSSKVGSEFAGVFNAMTLAELDQAFEIEVRHGARNEVLMTQISSIGGKTWFTGSRKRTQIEKAFIAAVKAGLPEQRIRSRRIVFGRGASMPKPERRILRPRDRRRRGRSRRNQPRL